MCTAVHPFSTRVICFLVCVYHQGVGLADGAVDTGNNAVFVCDAISTFQAHTTQPGLPRFQNSRHTTQTDYGGVFMLCGRAWEWQIGPSTPETTQYLFVMQFQFSRRTLHKLGYPDFKTQDTLHKLITEACLCFVVGRGSDRLGRRHRKQRSICL